MARPAPMEPTAETVVSFPSLARSIEQDEPQDEPQDSTKHEPKLSTLFEDVDPCVAEAPRKERGSADFKLSQTCQRVCGQSSAESVDRGDANLDGVQVQMKAEVETETERNTDRLDDLGVTEWLDDVGVTEWRDDVGVVSHSVQMDVSDCHCTLPHPLADAAWCMSSASQQHNLDAEAKDGSVTMDSGISVSSTGSDFTERVCTGIWIGVTVTCASMADCCLFC